MTKTFESDAFTITGRKRRFQLPDIVQEKIDERGWTVKDLAKAAKIPQATLYRNMRGENCMSIGASLSIIETLKFPMKSKGVKILEIINSIDHDLNIPGRHMINIAIGLGIINELAVPSDDPAMRAIDEMYQQFKKNHKKIDKKKRQKATESQ